MAKLISKCPICGGELSVPVLKCGDCGLELKNDFELSPFDRLSEEQNTFLISFLKNQGNLKSVQAELKLSYPAAKKKMADLLSFLGLAENTNERNEDIDMSSWAVNTESTNASDIVKAKLVANGGRATIRTLRGNPHEVWVVSGNTFHCSAAKNVDYTYDVFDVVVDHITAQGGTSRKGSARHGIGSYMCEDDTVAAAILTNYFHNTTGYDPSFFIIAILEWAGIVRNTQGRVMLTDEYKALRGL